MIWPRFYRIFAFFLLFGNLGIAAIAAEENKAEDWNASLYNDQYFDPSAANAVNQATSFTSKQELYESCRGTLYNGRSDAICSTSPNHPECVGANQTLAFATNCENPPDCTQKGANGFTSEEWIAFSTQYFKGIDDCTASMNAENNLTVAKSMESVTAITMGSESNSGINNSGALLGESTISFSGPLADSLASGVKGITGTQANEISESSIARTIESDGAIYLGFEKGEVDKKIQSGEAFLDIVIESPVYSKLSAREKTKWENAITESGSIIEGLKESKYAKLGFDPLDQSTLLTGLGQEFMTNNLQASSQDKVMETQSNQLQESHSAIEKSSSIVFGNSKSKNAAVTDLDAEVEPEREIASVGKFSGTSLREIKKPQVEDVIEVSLFQRVSIVYKRKTPQMKNLDASRVSKEIHSMEMPAFFRDL